MMLNKTMDDKPRIWIGTSWKMNKTLAESKAYSAALADTPVSAHVQGFIIPPYTVLREVNQMLKDTPFKVGAQNMHWDDAGAWTGEISGSMLKDCQVEMVEIGHSERRTHFGETDESVGLKVAAAIRHQLIPLICVGETQQQKETGQTRSVLQQQVTAALQHVPDNDIEGRTLLLAYEPVWAIGEAGVPASADYADEQQQFIKQCAQDVLGTDVPCLYGGSVNSGNCEELIARENIDGLFIGRAAWDVQGYKEILSQTSSILTQ